MGYRDSRGVGKDALAGPATANRIRGHADMSTFNPPESACGRVRGSLDSYVSGELDDAGGREVRRHMEGCPDCSVLADERERVRALVRRAVRREAVPVSLRMRIQEAIRKSGPC